MGVGVFCSGCFSVLILSSERSDFPQEALRSVLLWHLLESQQVFGGAVLCETAAGHSGGVQVTGGEAGVGFCHGELTPRGSSRAPGAAAAAAENRHSLQVAEVAEDALPAG